MALLSSLTLENFRSFRERTTFDLAPLTIITGPNSSGKSSLLKALLFLRHNARLNQLHAPTFAGGGHQLGSFGGIRSHGAKRDDTVAFGITFDWGDHDEWEYERGDGIRDVFRRAIGAVQFEFQYQDEAEIFGVLGEAPHAPVLCGFKISTDGDGGRPMFDIRIGMKVIPRHDGGAPIEYNFDFYYEGILHGDWFFEDTSDAHSVLGFPVQRMPASEEAAILLSRPLPFRLKTPSPVTGLESLADLVESACTITRWVNTEQDPTEDAINNEFVARGVGSFFRPYIRRWVDYAISRLGDLDHTAALRSSSERLYPDESGDGFSRLLGLHAQPLRGKSRRKKPSSSRDVRLLLQEFGIGDKLHVEYLASTAYTVEVERGGRRLHLADLGYGYTQLLPLLLHAVYDHDTDERPFPTLLVEEPETNLHPNLQARLADLLVRLSRPERSHVLVETHSEYLIRRLQYLVAKGEADRERIAIYYLGSDPEAEDYVRRITISPRGRLSEEFGPGFFDEATNLMVALYKYGSEN